MQVILALGSNLGNRLANIENALAQMDFLIRSRHSTIIEVAALMLANSPQEWNIPFLNLVITGETSLSPQELLKTLKQIESDLGRDLNAPRWSPRIIDIDILFYGDEKYQDDSLIIPHPEYQNRPFLQKLVKELT
jgi:2-amino-4-hydroxy-6-hydroxymethyldihydropteridine diphosphokinase/dihydropteroate synthase